MKQLPFKMTAKAKRDFIATEDFWRAAKISKGIEFSKENWDGNKRIKHLRMKCALCEYFGIINDCGECSLKIKCNPCPSFKNWLHARTLKSKQYFASIVFNRVKKFNDTYIRKGI